MANNSEKVEVFLREQDIILLREYRLDPGTVLRILGTSFCGILRRHETAAGAMRDFSEPMMISEIKKTAEVMKKERESVNSNNPNKRIRKKKKVKRTPLD